ncbi:hypothetical protein [Paraburkholderia bannensis]|uniref:hypothetical protein n=1 Tax=Paraburkholderia bannensis TaxID=765414 RepID=UPI0012EC866A|nr:hypothetical protein [Paraburkholderia bannensis]
MTVDDDDKVTRAYAKKYADADASEAFAVRQCALLRAASSGSGHEKGAVRRLVSD